MFFISEFIVILVSNNMGIFFIELVFYGIKWGYSLVGIVDCFISYFFVKLFLEGVRRKFVCFV